MPFKNVSITTGSGDFLKLVEGDNRIRILSEEPIATYSLWENGKPRHFSTRQAMSAAQVSAPEAKAKENYVVWVIDRKDGTCKLAQFGAQIASALQDIENDSEYGFVGTYPFDVTIKKQGAGLETQYNVMASRKETPLTDEEKKMVAALPSLKDKLADTWEDAKTEVTKEGEVDISRISF